MNMAGRKHMYYNFQSFIVWINAPDGIIAAAFFLARRPSTNPTRSEAGTGSIGRGSVIGETEKGNV